ncbi:MAG: hypothetical protein HY321_05290 [Armatimonadetes bacterium]|nr:hypothetical protein [Armatimonadota bacterium]
MERHRSGTGGGLARRAPLLSSRAALRRCCALWLAVPLAAGLGAAAPGAPEGEAAPPAAEPAAGAVVETRPEAIFPFTLAQRVRVDRRFAGWALESVTIVRRPHARPEFRTWIAEARTRSTGTRQVFPRVRVMLYREGRYLATCFMPPRTDPYQNLEPRRSRRFSGAVALPKGTDPDAFCVDDVAEVLAYTSQEGLPADEAAAAGKPVWMVQIDRRLPATCATKSARGCVFETPDGRRYLRLPNRETFLEGSVPPERLDPEALKKARARGQ